MSTATIPMPSATAWRAHRWTTAEFDALLAGGFLVEGTKTFLWDGEIIDPMPENLPHVNAQENLNFLFLGVLPREDWTVNQGHPLALRDGYKPQPDLAIFLGPRSDYRRHVPGPADAALVVEVSDSSYPQDSGDKLAEYARGGIPQYWIVNLGARRIEVYTGPTLADDSWRYAGRTDYPLEATVPLILSRGGEMQAFGEVPVLDILRDSLEDL